MHCCQLIPLLIFSAVAHFSRLFYELKIVISYWNQVQCEIKTSHAQLSS